MASPLKGFFPAACTFPPVGGRGTSSPQARAQTRNRPTSRADRSVASVHPGRPWLSAPCRRARGLRRQAPRNVRICMEDGYARPTLPRITHVGVLQDQERVVVTGRFGCPDRVRESVALGRTELRAACRRASALAVRLSAVGMRIADALASLCSPTGWVDLEVCTVEHLEHCPGLARPQQETPPPRRKRAVLRRATIPVTRAPLVSQLGPWTGAGVGGKMRVFPTSQARWPADGGPERAVPS
jgi:hypothetical protein